MDSIKKEYVIAGIIGGVTSLALAMIARRIIHKRCHGKWNRGPSQILKMQSD